MWWIDMHTSFPDAEASFDPAFHAITLQQSTSRTARSSIEYAPPQLFVTSHEIGTPRTIGAGECQRLFFPAGPNAVR
jgi:hypothetical protein